MAEEHATKSHHSRVAKQRQKRGRHIFNKKRWVQRVTSMYYLHYVFDTDTSYFAYNRNLAGRNSRDFGIISMS